MFGAVAADVEGRSLTDCLPAWLAGEELGLEAYVARGEPVADLDAVCEREGAPATHHAVSVFPIRDDAGVLTASAVVDPRRHRDEAPGR